MFRSRLSSTATAVFCASGVAGVALLAAQQQQQSRVAHTEQKLPKLMYFNITGLGFPIRAALNAGKVAFVDERLDFADVGKLRGPEGSNEQVPLGQLPLFVFPNGHVACQSNSILRWAGKKSGLYPKDDDEAQLVDEVLDTTVDFFGKLPQSKDAAELKKLREAFIQGDFAKQMKYYSRRLTLHPGKFLLGDKFTVADLKLAATMSYVAEGKLDHFNEAILKEYPVVWAHYQAVVAHPVYAEQMKREAQVAK
ncbi:hypothetical protein BASA81_001721 [Batrachochytrium salamandrivorans]|nr:hypothetical protein BASA81_001721 [Batrachochytrium salamandrivorans]